jgi:catechol 2,3-dioxygenase-like lactoylglutathione lyase family enzyme
MIGGDGGFVMPTTHAPVTPGLSQIGQIAVAVKDLPGSVTFYRDVLGLPFLFEAPPNLAFFDCGGVRLMLTVPEKPEFDHPASIIYFRVANIQETFAVLRSRGVTFESEPHVIATMPNYDLWMGFLRDPESNVLGVMSEVPRR